ncbi:rab3 GTPase-activating protein non-catalytic subunit isoform X2 [Ischnura elegans]|uniref:rab3 GTPase-activating protein non-catalytic subunit isoform X2 n=1 Tax=Ischnura elegans TaxID=197161 RepID=UPI001ED8B57B|nr:rab3 GTPase-activating protein non-catalytic subunit isoform X2 [Ischnura elegans]XP_046388411.1 rab3 GTPase-activating protein non-catalytic subunit isoform X2 [Ischnura elegans]XP_046388412.1 rab3 GTPase-activating protein non-catalytic subunit isoform X2 [Ischnura elegans]
MSCQLIPFAWFDVNSVRKRLFYDSDVPEILHGRSDRPEHGSASSESNSSWLHECLSYLSPSREILIFAKKCNVVILTSKWESQKKGNASCKYVVFWSGTLSIEKMDSITSILCLPLASVGKSSHHGADWTCIVVGYSSGFVGFYTENGSLIISEQFHEEPVVKLKCHSHIAPSYPGEIEHQEELIIVYQSAVVSLNGFALFQTLRGCRSHLAKVKANYIESVNPPPLAFKKWGFMEQRVAAVHGSGIIEEVGVNDCEVIGQSTPHSFDHLHHHHLLSSQLSSLSSFRPRPPNTSMVVATGLQPFVGFHHYVEGAGRQTIYRDVARAVTDRLVGTLSNTVSSWIFGGQNTQEKTVETRPSSEAADPMECRFGLCDPLRVGGNIVMSQNRRLSAVTDNLGRIILVDNFKGIAVRLWKGYRDAHCGWMEVMEESLHLEQQKQRCKMGDYEGSPSPHSSPIPPDGFRKAHFLVIHCPRSSILQVLSVQKGSKIATIPVAKGTRFLYMNHGLVGTNNVTHKKRRGHSESSCVIIEPSGFIKEILVPFHFALSEQSSEKVKDLHLIRRIKKSLRSSAPPCSSEVSMAIQSEICSLLGDLHCSQSLALALQTISTHRYTTVDLSLAAINAVLQRLQLDSAESESTSPAALWSMCQQLQQLISLYAKAKNAFQDEEIEGEDIIRKNSVPSGQLSEKEKEEVMMKKFKLSEYELKELLALLKLLKSAKDNAKTKALCRVSFADEHALSLPEYLSYFKLRIPDDCTMVADEKGMERWRDGGDPPTLSVSLKPSAQEQNMENICHFLFHECLASWRPHDTWKSAIAESGIKSKDLLLMVMNTWLWSGWHLLCLSFIDSLQRLTSVIQAVCSMPGNKSCIHSLSWWEEVRTLLSKCESPFVALVGAIAARVVATSRETCGQKCIHLKGRRVSGVKENAGGDNAHAGKEDGEVPVSREEEWEQVTLEDMAWDKLIHGLEDIAYLEAAIMCGPAVVKSQMVTSLDHVSRRGRGYISEMVAQWVLACSREFGEQRWSPEALIEILQKSSSDKEESQPSEPGSSSSLAFDLLVTLKNRFPQSLSISALTANITWECARLFASLKCNSPILSRTLEWLQAIPSFQIRRGVCGLMWAVHLEHRLRAAVQLLECYPHVDAIPEKVILDEVGLPSLLMLQDLFVNVHKFLELIREWVDVDVEDEEIEGAEELEESGVNHWYQDPWGPTMEKTEEEQGTQQLSNGPPLVELALVQPPLPPSLSSPPVRLDLFYQLSLAVCLLARVHPKGPTSLTQPISQLFNEKERALLLSLPDGDRHRGRLDSTGSILVRPRLLFVNRSISAICRSVDFSANLFKELISLALATAKSFGLPKDDIYRHLVCELYSCGRDQEAEELMSVVGDKESLASQLLVIVLQRLKHYLDHCGNADQRSQVMATFSPASLAKLNDQNYELLWQSRTLPVMYFLPWCTSMIDLTMWL